MFWYIGSKIDFSIFKYVTRFTYSVNLVLYMLSIIGKVLNDNSVSVDKTGGVNISEATLNNEVALYIWTSFGILQ